MKSNKNSPFIKSPGNIKIALPLLYFFPVILMLAIFAQNAEAKLIKVGPAESITSVKKAVNMAVNGDQIQVNGGVYREGNIIIEKQIELKGISNPVLDGEGKHEIMTVKADKVKVSGFTFKDSGNSSYKEMAGIRVTDSSEVTVKKNRFQNTSFAVYVANSKNIKIFNNNVTGEGKNESSYGNAVHIWKSNNISVKDNNLEGHRDGIYFEFVKNSSISGNKSDNNLRYGLHFMFSDGNDYLNNSFSQNGAGVAVMYTKNIRMIGNSFENNWGPASYGLLLKDISRSEIKNNRFSKNTVGIYMEGSSKLDIRNNNFINNGWSLRLSTSCTENKFSYNNFSGNSFDISTNATFESLTTNIFSHNYWDKYKGYDLNKDKIGDVPYRPVSLFSMVVEKIPHSVMLLRSLTVDILDITEKVIPAFIPKSIIDEKPLMKMVK